MIAISFAIAAIETTPDSKADGVPSNQGRTGCGQPGGRPGPLRGLGPPPRISAKHIDAAHTTNQPQSRSQANQPSRRGLSRFRARNVSFYKEVASR
jgi:hypothetical protein